MHLIQGGMSTRALLYPHTSRFNPLSSLPDSSKTSKYNDCVHRTEVPGNLLNRDALFQCPEEAVQIGTFSPALSEGRAQDPSIQKQEGIFAGVETLRTHKRKLCQRS